MTELRFTTRFMAQARRYQPSKQERQEALASLSDLKNLLPANIDPTQDVDIVYVAGNLAVGGTLNANDDGVTIADSLAIYKRFERRLVDVEHDRKQLRGFIVSAGLSEVGTDKLITEEEARVANQPFNIAIAIALWKIADRDLCEYILEQSMLDGGDMTALSFSFEVGFNDYSIVLLPRDVTDLAQAVKIIPSSDRQFDSYDRLLRVNKGSGRVGKTGDRVGRILGGALVPLGAGIVTVPAAAVKGLTPITQQPDTLPDNGAQANPGVHRFSSTQLTLDEAQRQHYMVFGESIPEDHIYKGDGSADSYGPGYGRETEPHVTSLYGIKSSCPACTVAAIAETGPVTVTMGKVSAFENANKPYDVLKVDVDSTDLHLLNATLKGANEWESEYDGYHPHLTIAYVKKGMATPYIGDTRFEGHKMTFNHLTFSSHEGDRTTIPFKGVSDSVYTPDTAMATNRVKIPAGLLAKAKELNYPKADVTLSDGRVLKGVTVFSGTELDLDKDLDMQGVVITALTMTPQMPPQIDDDPIVHPHVNQQFPTRTPERRADDAKDQVRKHILQNMPYTDAAVTAAVASLITALNGLSRIIDARAGVSSPEATASLQTTSTMPTTHKIEDLQSKLKSATKPEELAEAVANVSVFAREIEAASEQYVKDADKAKKEKAEAEVVSSKLKEDLAAANKAIIELRAAQAATEAQASFDERMTVVAETFSLDDEVRAFVIEDVRSCADASAFDKWLARAKKTMKAHLKSAKAGAQDVNSQDTKRVDPTKPGAAPMGGAQTVDSQDTTVKTGNELGSIVAKKTDKKDDDADMKDDDACAAAQAAIASAQLNPTDKTDLDTIGDLKTKTLRDQMMAAFARNAIVAGQSVDELTKTK